MERYIGLDVHDNCCSATVIDARGKKVLSQVLETNGAALKTFVSTVPKQRFLAIEEGNLSNWLYEELSPLVTEMIVVVPPPSRGGPHNDSLDSFKLAEGHRTAAFRTRVFKAHSGLAELRSAVRAYLALRKDVTRVKSRTSALFRSRGLFGLGDDLYESESRKQHLPKLRSAERGQAELFGKELDALQKIFAEAEKKLEHTAEKYPQVRRLMTIPGIATVRAAIIVAVVGTPHRFRTADEFCSYCGLGIVSPATAEYTPGPDGFTRRPPKGRHLNLNRNAHLKEVFKATTVGLIGRSPTNPLVIGYRARCADGMEEGHAQLTMTRQLASMALAMWKREEDYDPDKAAIFARRATVKS